MNAILCEATGRLRGAGTESPRAEARILWEHAHGNVAVFGHLVERRLRHEPAAYITGHKEFWSLDFAVGSGVLIPRPETETLIETAMAELPEQSAGYRILDIGTGSGCLVIALLKEYPAAAGVGIDSSEEALVWARRNVERHRLESRCTLRQGIWEVPDGDFDLIVSNPPYIPSGDLPGLQPDVRDHEPRAALDGGVDGLDAYRALAQVLNGHLLPTGTALLEIGAGQAHLVQEIMLAAGLKVRRIAADLAGIPRCMVVCAAKPLVRLKQKTVGNRAGSRYVPRYGEWDPRRSKASVRSRGAAEAANAGPAVEDELNGM